MKSFCLQKTYLEFLVMAAGLYLCKNSVVEFLRKRKRLYHHSTEESLLETIQERNSIIIFPWMIFKCLTNTKTFLNFVGLWNEKLQNIQHQFLSEEKIHTHLYTYLYIYMKKKILFFFIIDFGLLREVT